MSEPYPLTPDAPKLWSMPSGPGFVDRLAETLAEVSGLKDNPVALADAQIFVPNQRSARALATALFQASGRDGFLPPAILPLGDIAGEPPSTLLSGLGVDAPPALDEHTRMGILMKLVMGWGAAKGDPMSPASAFVAAKELGELIGMAAMLGTDPWPALPGLVEDVALATHWEVSLDFLKIVTENWPQILIERHASEPLALRRVAADALIKNWRRNPPEFPVIVAGSTGATPVSRDLMAAALELPQGLVVLPGLDHGLDDISRDEIASEPSHPQHVLIRTLHHLKSTATDVSTWPGKTGNLGRRDVLKLALAPKNATADWLTKLGSITGEGDLGQRVRSALNDLSRIETNTEAEEARVAALILREALETPDLTTALVTTDATMGRRVSAELKRWGIDVEQSAGTPLLRTERGRLCGLLLDWLIDPGDPVVLLAVLNHPLVRFGTETVEALEFWRLRGPRNWQGLDGLIGARSKEETGTDAIDHLVHALITTVEPWTRFEDGAEISSVARELAVTLEALTGDTAESGPWLGRDGEALVELLRGIDRLGSELKPVTLRAARDFIMAMASDVSITDPDRRHPQIQILGPLEARLISIDRVILAGLNEGTWPDLPGAQALLPRQFRVKLGLPDPEERIGLAAHDFASLASAKEVFLLRSKRIDNQPSVPSRWWWRLSAICEGALGAGEAASKALGEDRGQRYLDWARSMDRHVDGLPHSDALRPEPRPPLGARPKQISVTQVETLIRDPYAIYASKTLRLKALQPVGAEMDAAARGTAIHRAVEIFEDISAEEATAATLLELLQNELLLAGQAPEDLRAEQMALLKTSEDYVEWREKRLRDLGVRGQPELRGALEIPVGDQRIRLTGRADRIETYPDGGVSIMDFKSGQPPTAKQVKAGLSAQMPLLAAIAVHGGFAELSEITEEQVRELIYLRLSGGLTETEVSDPEGSTAGELAHEALKGFRQLMSQYADPTKPYLSKPVAKYLKDWGDYDRLARRAEWADQGAGDGGADP